MSKYTQLINDMADDEGSPWVDAENWLYNNADYDQFIAAGAIYWPEFLEYKGCIIRDSAPNNYVANYDRLVSTGPVERGYVEERLNRLEIVDIILPPESKPILMIQAQHIGRTLAQMWKAKLAMNFPTTKFHVSFIEHEGDDVSDLEITFCQEHSFPIGG